MTITWTESGSLTAGDKQLEYTCIGQQPDEAPTLLLLHEGLGCIALWRDFPTRINEATGFGVFVYSRAGYGQSDPADLPRPLDYMSREAIESLPQILDKIDARNVVLIGHSDGASIAAIHAGKVIDPRVIGVVLIAPHFFTEAMGLKEIALARDAFNQGDLRTRLAKYHKDPDNAFRGWNDSWLNPGFKIWNVEDSLDNIQVPVLAIQGREDPYGSLNQIDVVAKRVVHATTDKFILDDCLHAPHLEHPANVIEAISSFCSKLNPLTYPSHAYLPGINERHPENTFDTLRQTAVQGMDVNQLAQCKAYRSGLQFLKSGFYWEAHEVLEPVWMSLADDSAEKGFVQGIIQLANGRLKLKMHKPKASLRLVAKARALLPDDESKKIMQVPVLAVSGWIDSLEHDANNAL